MALARFLQPKSAVLIYRIGVSSARTIRFSTNCRENEKKTIAAPKEIEVGGPLSSLKNVFHKLKDTMLRPIRSQDDHNTDASTPSVDPSASMVTASHNVPDYVSTKVQDSELLPQSQHAEKSHKEINGDDGASVIAGHAYSALVVEETSSEVNQMQNPLPFPISEEADDLTKTSLSILVAPQGTEENFSNKTLDINYADVNKQGNGSAVLSTSSLSDLDRLLMSDIENLSSSRAPGLGEESTVAEGVLASRLGITGSEEGEQMKRREVVMARSGSAKKAKRLSGLFSEKSCDGTGNLAGNEGTTRMEALTDVLLNPPEQQVRATSDLPGDHITKLPPIKCEKDSQEYEKLNSRSGKMSTSSNPTRKLPDLHDFSKKSSNDHEAEEIPEQKSRVFTLKHLENLKKSSKEGENEKSDIHSLIDLIRQQEDVRSSTTSDPGKSSFVPDSSFGTKALKLDNKNYKLTLGKYPPANSKVVDEETSSLDSEPIDQPDLKTSSKILVSEQNKDLKELKNSLEAEKAYMKNKVLVRFLRNDVNESQIRQGLSGCGEISKVEIHHDKEPLLKVASVYFETSKGVELALRNCLFVVPGVVIVELPNSEEKMTKKVPIPRLVGDRDVPTALVKNPTRTIKIENLTRDMRFCDIQEVLALSEINISGYFFGSSSSAVYVELETETAKEEALAKHSINVSGRTLVMLRIDAPRTTVVRISNIRSLSTKNIVTACKSLGDVRMCNVRSPDIIDVNFALAEWPNMLKILNRLNRTVVDDRRLQAEPAPVFPADVFLALWDQPVERKYLKATMHDLLLKLGKQPSDTFEVASMVDNFSTNFIPRVDKNSDIAR